MFRFTTLLLVGGCPYVFEQPNLSNVDTDGRTPVTDSDFDGDTGDTEVGGPGAPTLTSLEVTPRLDAVVFTFSVADVENDLVGGSLRVTDGIDTFLVAIPGDLDVWDPFGLSKATVLLGEWIDCDTPSVDRTWTVTPTDFADHVGTSLDAFLHIAALGRLPESGNRWPQDAHRVDEAPPFMGCVTYTYDPDEPGTMREQLFNDLEGVFFVTPESRDYRVSLTWAPDADLDVYVLPDPIVDVDGDGNPDVAAFSTTYSRPEQAVVTADAGDSWLFDPTFFDLVSGGLPPFDGFFLVSPE